MHKLYELKEMLCAELEKYGTKELTAGSLDVVDKLAHAVKNLDKIIESSEDGEYSNADGRMMRSYARGGRRSGRSYAQRRDARGRYSNERGYSMANDDIIEGLMDLMQDADEMSKTEIQRLVDKLEKM